MENLSEFYYSICGAEASTEFYYSICGAEASTECYYKEEQRPSGSFQKKWDQGFFFPLKMSSLLFFFRQETEQLVFTKLGMI